MNIKRDDGRSYNQLRTICFKHDVFGYADASMLLEIGLTKVLASVTLQNNVPHFLRGQNSGWLSAEYAMLPCSTHRRTIREVNQNHRNFRSIEISRLIGRCLRCVVDLSLIPDKSIIVDCDVLQADGGTRVASITAASLALQIAEKRWVNNGIIEKNIVKEKIAAISVGVLHGNPILDLAYSEDSRADADFNFIFTKSGKLIEIQGAAEKVSLSWQAFEDLKNLALDGTKNLFTQSSKFFESINAEIICKKNQVGHVKSNKKLPFFSIANRVEKVV